MRNAITKTTLFLLVTSILMTLFYCGTSSSSEPGSVGYNGTPDSIYEYYGPGYSPDYYNLGQRVRFNRYGCPNKLVRVTPDNFFMCYLKDPISVLTDDTFLFDKFGDYYFLCDEDLCSKNEVRYQVRIGHYEPKSPSPAASTENRNVAPASEPALFPPSPSEASGSSLSHSPAPISPSPAPSEASASPLPSEVNANC